MITLPHCIHNTRTSRTYQCMHDLALRRQSIRLGGSYVCTGSESIAIMHVFRCRVYIVPQLFCILVILHVGVCIVVHVGASDLHATLFTQPLLLLCSLFDRLSQFHNPTTHQCMQNTRSPWYICFIPSLKLDALGKAGFGKIICKTGVHVSSSSLHVPGPGAFLAAQCIQTNVIHSVCHACPYMSTPLL